MMIRTLLFCSAGFGLILLIQSQALAGQVARSHSRRVDISVGRMLVAQHGHMQHDMGQSQMPTKGAEKGKEKAHEHMDHAEKMSSSSALEPAEGATVEILSPGPMQVFHGDEVPLRYRFVKGKRGHHVHAYVDGTLMGMFKRDDETLIGEGTLTGIRPGRHTLELRTVTADHKTELNAVDVVEFSVE